MYFKNQRDNRKLYFISKRVVDILICIIGISLLWPVFFLIAFLIKLDGGPVLYKAKRVGAKGKIFNLYKFRTMVPDADKIGPPITASNDPRITRLGRWLRRTKVDELPQLFNVLKGEMSLVGPRPEDPTYVALYTEEQKKILNAVPGITSAASLAYRDEEKMLPQTGWESVYKEKILPRKIAIDLEYMRKSTLVSDMLLILRTFLAMLK